MLVVIHVIRAREKDKRGFCSTYLKTYIHNWSIETYFCWNIELLFYSSSLLELTFCLLTNVAFVNIKANYPPRFLTEKLRGGRVQAGARLRVSARLWLIVATGFERQKNDDT